MIAFAGSPLDRADQLRVDPAALAERMDARARLLRLDGLMPVIGGDGMLEWGSLAEVGDDAEIVFLGLDGDRACFVAVPGEGAGGPAYSMPAVWQAMSVLSSADLAIYGGARSLADWHARHRFCARCGGRTSPAKGGWQRNCASCGAEHFPRTDPVTIMLVEHGDRLLLARQPRFPPQRFSAPAGFVEPGETIEEAVRREILEETGITTGEVTYVASQPWPFPSQLMIGCHAVALDDAITLDENELEEAHWFSRDEIAAAMARDENARFIAPPPQAIAHNLLQWWLDR
ncbi:MAG: NAD(+) diphosphatase [Sphingomonadales bacterium]|nr:NAD(+) diphosphatase [Sphingomonadales bacterium]MBD3774558.1 NAD(+) diphosphatase [Paracoccaceae bacterium]